MTTQRTPDRGLPREQPVQPTTAPADSGYGHDGRSSYQRDACIHELFAAQVAQTPDAIAVEFAGETVTYDALNRRANQVAHHLRRRGVGTETMVGLCVERSVEMVVGILGILKAGGAYVPLDPAYPALRLELMVKDIRTPVLLTQASLEGELPAYGGEVIRLDADWPEIAREPADGLASGANAGTLAYVMYTSGSTGRPKGVGVTHRNVVRLVQETNYIDVGPEDVFLQVAPISFDASTLELWGPLLNGAKLVVYHPRTVAVHELAREIEKKGVTTLWLTSALFQQMVDTEPECLRGVRQVLAGGDVLSVPHVKRVIASLVGDRRLINGYGPTENTTFTCCHVMDAASTIDGTVPIGHPIANTQVHILDAAMRTVPVGEPGELYAGGDGVARGYLHAPAATAARFVPDPFGGEPGARLYRTGDLAKRREDGTIEFICRADRQVKLRGFRIELGEIEAALVRHDRVREAVAMVREDDPDNKRIVAYVVADGDGGAVVGEHLAEWQTLYERSYGDSAEDVDEAFNIIGWNSSYSGNPIPAEEMREWVDSTVQRIKSLRPQRILEIGCGTGLLLHRLAPGCERYVGTDFSEVALNFVQRAIEARGLGHAELRMRAADEFTGVEPGSFDAVVINSVIQYFPGAEYLVRVLEGAVDAVQPGGHIFIGDVRSLPLLQAFHTSVQMTNADRDGSTAVLRDRIHQHLVQDQELVVDPAMFTALARHLARVSRVEIEPKRGRYDNELSRFRYDVTLWLDAEDEGPPTALDWRGWRAERFNADRVRRLLDRSSAAPLALRGVPNPRTTRDARAVELLDREDGPKTLAELERVLDGVAVEEGMSPEDIHTLGEMLSYTVHASWSAGYPDGSYDVVFWPADADGAAPPAFPISAPKRCSWSSYTNNPVRRRVERTLGPQLRDHLTERLPEYMIPSAFVTLDALPLSPNGKIDRRALPAPSTTRPEVDEPYVEPRTPLERTLAAIWQDVLGLDRVGANDDFFKLGGDSLLAARVAIEIQNGIDEIMHVTALFDAPTIAALAEYLVEHYPSGVRKLGSGEESPDAAEVSVAAGGDESPRVTVADVAVLREIIQPLSPPSRDPRVPKNPPAVLILSPPRSGSSLLRIMLGGHPRLFAPPELELLAFDTLRERRDAHGLMLEGTIRAIMELRDCDADEAKRVMADFEQRGLSVAEFYGVLQDWIGDRVLVDKSADYAANVAALRRAEETFENPVYVHLVRHPCATANSFEKMRLDRIVRYRHPFSARRLGEILWQISHENVLEFLATVPQERYCRVRYEDLVRHPAAEVERICQLIGIDVHPDMLDPYRNQEHRMTDGLYAGVSRPISDIKFSQYKKIEPSAAEGWKRWIRPASLGDSARRLARELGYDDVPAPDGDGRAASGVARADGIRRVPRDAGDLPLSYGQERLWLTDQMGAGAAYNMFRGWRFEGDFDAAAMTRALRALVDRHESLRTCFPVVAGEPVQKIETPGRVEPQWIDLTGRPEAEALAEVERLMATEVQTPFDLARGPLVRGTVVAVQPDEHRVLLGMHHSVCDGWSLLVLERDLLALYDAFARGAPPELPELPIQYADFGAWQRQWLQGPVLEDQLSYWRTQLAGLETLELPTDAPRPAELTYDGAVARFTIPGDVVAGLRGLSRARGVTMAMALQAAFTTLLHRYCRQDDIVIGVPVAGRTRREIEPLVGFFVNSLVQRTDHGGDPTFGELLERTRRTAVASYRHQELPFELLVRELQPERDLSRNPLFQVEFAWIALDAASGVSCGPGVERLVSATFKTHFDLHLQVTESGGELPAHFVYNTKLFDAPTIERMARHLLRLIEGAVADPERRVSALPMLSADERQRMLVAWNETERPFPADQCLHTLFERQVERTPERVAVVDGERTLSYAALNARADALAARLRALGVGAEVPVGLYVERGAEMVAAVLAVLKSGGFYLPLDPGHPRERIRFMLEDAGVPVVIAPRALVSDLEAASGATFGTGGTVILCPDDERAPAIGGGVGARAAVRPDQLAYLIYTSGSTGVPKGVQVSHRNVVNFLASMRREPGIDAGDALLAVTTLSFDIAGLELLLPLLAGARVVIASSEAALDAHALPRLLREAGVTVMQATPATWQMLVQTGWPGDRKLKVLCGGEALPRALADDLLERAGEVWNLYGPTETTIWSSVARVEPPPGAVTIGGPIANTQLYVLDANLEPVPAGVAGELLIGGAGVARGYLDRPALTAGKFVPDPFGGASGARLYRTGDLCRRRRDGSLEFVGRIDHQVKVRGFRIELGEIESVLGEHPAVAQAIAALWEQEPGDQRLIAYVVASEAGSEPDLADLERHVRERLPAFMVPSRVVLIEAIPLTANGKIDRRSLPAPDWQSQQRYVAPTSPLESKLVEIWQDILRVERVGIEDDFFGLGGHSILAARVMARVRHAIGIDLTMREIFFAPTVSKLAQRIELAMLEAIEQMPEQKITQHAAGLGEVT